MAKSRAATILANIARLPPEDIEHVRAWRDAVGEERFVAIVATLVSGRGAPTLEEQRMPLLRAMAAKLHANPTWPPYRAAVEVESSSEARRLVGKRADDSLRRWLNRHWGKIGTKLLKEHKSNLSRIANSTRDASAVVPFGGSGLLGNPLYEQVIQLAMLKNEQMETAYRAMRGGATDAQVQTVMRQLGASAGFDLLQLARGSKFMPPLPPPSDKKP